MKNMKVASNNAPGDIEAEIEKALCYHNSGQLQRAEGVYRQILANTPDHPDVLHLLGLVLHQSGNQQAAIQYICEAIRYNSDNPCYYGNLGVVYYAQNRLGPAISCYHKALELKPDYADAYNNLANVLRKQGDLNQAAAFYQKALQFQPDDAVAFNNLGQVYREMGRYKDEIACYQQALRVDSDHVQTYLNLGNALQYQGELDKSIGCYQRALEKTPDYAEAYNNCGTALLTQGKLYQSRSCYQKAIQYNPQYADAYNNLGNVFHNQGQFEEAIFCFQKTLEVKPDYVKAHDNLLYTLHHIASVGPQRLYEEAKKWWYDQGLKQDRKPLLRSTWDPSRRLKIGYVSPDFREHSVSYFFRPLLEFCEPNSFEIICYSDARRPDHITARLKALSNHWRDTAWSSDTAVAERIREDGIDILVDLAGHTSGNRLSVFARKPAPVQMTWLGYPGTTGLSVIDYRVTDDICDPHGESDQYHSENLIRLADGFLCYSPPDTVPDVSELPARKADRISFGSFNNLPKINEQVIALWSQILRQVPESCLKLKSKQLADEHTRQSIWKLFSSQRIQSERVILLPRVSSTAEHLALYHQIDIGLDPFPYNGTTTTCEALWMGIPVITLRGDCHSARVGTSILTRVGLTEMIAEGEEQYVRIGMELAKDLDRLEQLRAGMRTRMQHSVLCDGKSFTRAMEDVYQKVWKNWCQTDPGLEQDRKNF
jgi:predicted O-linked N-acetylglucosamine transferase (SPINDLY family)